MGGVSAVCKCMVLALAVLIGAAALCNTVTNDVVVATSDAELRISDRGLGLGLEVVGGGAAEVKLEARPGWRFRDGSTSVTLNKAAGEAATSPEVKGEGKGAEGYVPGIEVGDDDEDWDDEDGSVEHEKPVLSLTASAPKVVAYSVLDGGTNVSISLSATVTTKGKHRKLDANGNVVKEEEFSPKRYVWKMTGAATGEAETDSSTHTFVVSLTKGKDKKLHFSVVGKICGICDGEVESDAATDSVEIDVYELSISRPDYLGLDRTDAGRQGHVVKTATLSSDPSLPSSSSVEWTECGICEFVGAKNQRSVSYQNKDSDTASGVYLAERLAASVRLAGMDSAVVCSTNFTVVKVDIELSDIVEEDDEKALPPVEFVADNADGSLSKTGLRSLYQMHIKCEPYDVPGSVDLQFSFGISLFEITSFDGDKPVSAVPAQSSYPCGEIGQKKFGIHVLSASVLEVGELIVARHAFSGALDYARVKVVPPPPMEVSVELKSPAKGGGWPYDPIWDDSEWALTVDGSLAKQCAEDTDEALVITTLSRDAQQVDGGIYEWGLIWDDKIISFQVDPSEGVHTNYWGMAPNLKASEYLAKVVAVEKETGDNRPAKSNTGEVERKPYYYSGAQEVMELTNPHVVTRAEYDDAVSALNRGVTVLSALSVAPLALIPGPVWVNIALGIGGGFGFSELYSNAMALPHWFQNGSRIYWTSWVVTRYDWDGSNYAILPNEIRFPDVGVDGMEKKSIFEMGYQKVIYLGDDGSTSTNAISYHSREYEWTNVQGKYWDVSSVWKWAPIPNSRYGLSEPKIMTK